MSAEYSINSQEDTASKAPFDQDAEIGDQNVVKKLYDQDAENFNSMNFDSANFVEQGDVLIPTEIEFKPERVYPSLDDMEKSWSMEDMKEQAERVLAKARAEAQQSKLTKVAIRVVEGSIDMESIGFVIGMAARAYNNETMAQIGTYAMSSAWIAREAASRFIL